MRAKLFTMRMSERERARLDRLAERHGLTAAKLIRSWMDREEVVIGAFETRARASVFEQAQALYEQSRAQTNPGWPAERGDPRRSRFVEEDRERLYLLDTGTVVLAVFKLLKNGRLRLLPR